jgi:hypothetical protein
MDDGVGVVGRPRAVGWSRPTNSRARQDVGTKTPGGMKADQSTAKLVVAGQGRSVAIELTAEGTSSMMTDTHNKNAARRLQ